MVADAIRLVMFPALMAFAASSDFVTMTISNKVSLALIAGFAALAVLTGMSMAELGSHVGAAALVLAVTFVFFARGWIGGGDAKLAASTTLWLGFDRLVDYGLYAALMGGALTVGILFLRRWPLPSFLRAREWIVRLHDRGNGVPYGIALAVAGLLLYPETAIWVSAINH
jgi:prepilin peptidase CpaA